MPHLIEYVLKHTRIGICMCRTCAQPNVAYRINPKHTIDMLYFDVAVNPQLNLQQAGKWLKVAAQHSKGFHRDLNVFDGNTHTYVEIGAWLGTEELGLRFMALASACDLLKILL